MFAVERLGSYITRGVNTVSGPFHPFGGAVDIVVVEQQDGSFKSSPWYIRFGKFQGVLKAKEKVVNIGVDGVEANFHMYLDHRGVAYFLREVDVEEVDTILSPLSSGEEADGQCHNRRPVKSKSCNYDANQSDAVTQIDLSNGKVVARTSSRRSRILGLVFGRRSMKEDGAGVVRADLLERAEIAADLLDVKWSTNLASGRYRKDNASCFPASDILDSEENKDLQIDDGQSQVESLVLDNIMNGLDNDSFPPIEATDLEFFIGTSPLGESGFEGANELNSETSRKIDGLDVANAYHDKNAEGVVPEISSPRTSQIIDLAKLEPCPSEKLDEEHVFDEEDGGFLDSGVSKEENGADRVQSFIYCETSESSRIELDDFDEQANETLYNTTELVSKVNSQLETGLLVEEPLNFQGVLQDENCCSFFNDANILENEITPINTNTIVPETYSETVTVHPANDSAKEVGSSSVFTISSFSNSDHQAQDEKSTREEDKMNELRPSLEPVGGDDFVPTEAINVIPSEGSGEEQFLFSDLDDLKLGEVKSMESIFVDHLEEENRSSLTSKGSETLNEPLLSNFESVSSPVKFVGEKMPDDVEELRQTSKIKSSHIDVPSSSKVAGQEVGRMVESLPNMWSHSYELDTQHLRCSLGHSLDSNSKSPKWMLLREDVSSCIKSAADDEHQLSNSRPISEDAQMSKELKNAPASPAVGDPSEITESPGGSWGIWRFPKSRSMKGAQPTLNCTRNFDSENALGSTIGMDGEKDVSKPKVNKKIIRAITPTSEQLASLNLKEGRNTITFTFSTAMLGKQQVDARIYLWRWDTRIVISDVDGTITKPKGTAASAVKQQA